MQHCKVFKSTQSPVRFTFQTARNEQMGSTVSEAPTSPGGAGPAPLPSKPLQILFKSGDDIRQDQFVTQVLHSLQLPHIWILHPKQVGQAAPSAVRHRDARCRYRHASTAIPSRYSNKVEPVVKHSNHAFMCS